MGTAIHYWIQLRRFLSIIDFLVLNEFYYEYFFTAMAMNKYVDFLIISYFFSDVITLGKV